MVTTERQDASVLVLDALILAMALEEAPDPRQEREIVTRWLAARQARRAAHGSAERAAPTP